MASSRDLKKVKIASSTPNKDGVTLTLGNFESVKITIPKPTYVDFGTFFDLYVGGRLVHQKVILQPEDMPGNILLKACELGCCWQVIYYTLTLATHDRRTSEKLYVLVESK
ncbi:hypothetical protein [Pseudomonas yamanorum]